MHGLEPFRRGVDGTPRKGVGQHAALGINAPGPVRFDADDVVIAHNQRLGEIGYRQGDTAEKVRPEEYGIFQMIAIQADALELPGSLASASPGIEIQPSHRLVGRHVINRQFRVLIGDPDLLESRVLRPDSHRGRLPFRSPAKTHQGLRTLSHGEQPRSDAVPHDSPGIPLTLEKIDVLLFDRLAVELHIVDADRYVTGISQHDPQCAEFRMVLVQGHVLAFGRDRLGAR